MEKVTTSWRRVGTDRAGTDEPGQRPDGPGQRSNTQWFWLFVVVLFVLNWIVASALLAPARATVSYTFFREQVVAKNVVEITSTGDTIVGTFRRPVRYPPG